MQDMMKRLLTVAVLGLALTWWLMAPQSPQPAVAIDAVPSAPAEPPRQGLPTPAVVAAAPVVAVAGPAEAVALPPPPPPTRTAALDPDRILQQEPPAAGPVSVPAETPRVAEAVTTPAAPPVSGGTAPGAAAAPAGSRTSAPPKASDTAASRCRQALLEKSLGMASAAADVGKYCR
jgi:hypothetical protein